MALLLPRREFAHTLNQGWVNVAIWAALAVLYVFNILPVIEWVLSQGALPFSLGVLGLLMLLGMTLILRLVGIPDQRMSWSALTLILLCSGLSLFTFPILQQLSAAFALLGVYGFTSAFSRMSAGVWRQGLVLAALASLAIPFALVRGTGLGFYLRLMTADAAAQALSWFGHASLGAHDVLIFDNGIAQVDAPCSGLKSLFTGTGFFLVASLILRRRVSRSWMGLYLIFIGLLLVANTVRVITLIYLAEIAGKHSVAEAIHMPLGLVLFSLCCLFGLWGLTRVKSYKNLPETSVETSPLWLSGMAVFALCLMVLTHFQDTPEFSTKLTPPSAVSLESVSLTPTEVGFFEARDNTKAQKWMFEYQGLSGSMLVVQSRAANGLHAPEVCFLGNGISVDDMRSMSSGNQNYRWLTVDESRRNAMYWMQSAEQVTDDFRVRLSRFIFSGHRDWTLVTVLLDERHNPDAVAVQDLRHTLITHYKTNGS